MIYLIDPTDLVREGCKKKVSCSPRFVPLYGIPV